MTVGAPAGDEGRGRRVRAAAVRGGYLVLLLCLVMATVLALRLSACLPMKLPPSG